MRTEIGSEFWNVPITESNHLFSSCTEWFISGRSALRGIIAENHFKTAAVPLWCCDSMIKPFLDAGVKVIFYKENPKPADVVLIMDYFGYTSDVSYESYDGAIIRDLTHSLFSKSYDDADYYFGSLRKWAGFWTGGYAWGFKKPVAYEPDTTSYVEFRKVAMELKLAYMKGSINSKTYLSIFDKAEKELENVGILPAAKRDIELAKHLDVYSIKEQRRKNANVLLEAFSDLAIYPELKDTDCPMFVPILVKNRDNLRQYLIQHDIYCPVHWPMSELHNLDEKAKKLYREELSLICDQRYTEDDMNRIVKVIHEYINEEG